MRWQKGKDDGGGEERLIEAKERMRSQRARKKHMKALGSVFIPW
jgi:hypothetical protein